MSPLLETCNENFYILVAIDHYSKWVEAHAIADHTTNCKRMNLEVNLVCCFGLPNHVLTDNGYEWGGGGGEFVENSNVCIISHHSLAYNTKSLTMQWNGKDCD
jgi:hypothetical protein